jgi:hypothetical protein
MYEIWASNSGKDDESDFRGGGACKSSQGVTTQKTSIDMNADVCVFCIIV